MHGEDTVFEDRNCQKNEKKNSVHSKECNTEEEVNNNWKILSYIIKEKKKEKQKINTGKIKKIKKNQRNRKSGKNKNAKMKKRQIEITEKKKK